MTMACACGKSVIEEMLQEHWRDKPSGVTSRYYTNKLLVLVARTDGCDGTKYVFAYSYDASRLGLIEVVE